MSWERVRAWRDALRGADLSRVEVEVSPQGLREAVQVALDALDDASLSQVRDLGLRPFPTAVVVVAGTVSTAPVEWCAVLLGRGSQVFLKHASAAPGLAPVLVAEAQRLGLPLTATAERSVVSQADLVVVMGSDETISEIRGQVRPSTRLLPHGHKISAAFLTQESSWDGVASDAALHDGRGCLSPSLVLTTRPLTQAVDGLAEAMEAAQASWPRGTVRAQEAAHMRSRRALARAAGQVREGDAWMVLGIGAAHAAPLPLPRVLQVVEVADLHQALEVLRPWSGVLSTVGTDDSAAASAWLDLGATRLCRPGRMQRPPLIRAHDGEEWLRVTGIATSVEL